MSEKLQLPTRTDIDLKLLLGASLFGVGWGLTGVCPGPALIGAMADNGGQGYIYQTRNGAFLVAMFGGTTAHKLMDPYLSFLSPKAQVGPGPAKQHTTAGAPPGSAASRASMSSSNYHSAAAESADMALP